MSDEEYYYVYEGDYYRMIGESQDAQRYAMGHGFVPADGVMLHYRARAITKAEFQKGITSQALNKQKKTPL